MAANEKNKIQKIYRARKLAKLGLAKQAQDGADTITDYGPIQQQVEQEFQLCLTFMRPKVDEWLRRLKLYNNQARSKDKVGYPLIYSVHQAIHANLTGDRLQQEFKAREEGDQDQAENLDCLSDFDRDEMRKDELDEAWNWDAEIFGRGIVQFNNFDLKTKTPIPEVLDPTTFLRDPMAISVKGNRNGNGGLRFAGIEIYQTKAELESNPEYFNLDELRYGNDELTSLTGQSRRARQQAQGLPSLTNWENLTTNYKYGILRWFTHLDGKPHLVELGNNRTLVVRIQELDWHNVLIDRPFSPISHDWDGVSIMDLLEDKQRYGANMMNLAGDIVKADLNGMWIYRGQGFRKEQDFNFKFGKWIEYNGTGPLQDAAQPLQMKRVSDGVKYVMDWLNLTSQVASGTPSMQQGQPQAGDQTLGENQMAMAGSENRYSLTARIYGWSEKAFWRQWYDIYDQNFATGLGTKIARLEGAFGTKWKEIARKDIVTGNTMGPDIKIESKTVSEAKKQRQLAEFNSIEPLVLQDAEADQMYYKRKKAKLILPKDEVERIFPVTVDEYEAREENDKLNDEIYPQVTLEQNHVVHLREHAAAKDSETTTAHIKAHQYMLQQKRIMPHLFPQMPQDQQSASSQENPTQPVQNLPAKPPQNSMATMA